MSTEQYFFRTRIESIAEPEVRDEFDAQIAAFWWDRSDPRDAYTPVGIVTHPGRVVGIVPEEESRRDLGGDGTHIWAGIPKGQRWEWTWLRALRAVAEDLELFRDRRDRDQATRKIGTLSFDDLLRAIHRDVPERLAVVTARNCKTGCLMRIRVCESIQSATLLKSIRMLACRWKSRRNFRSAQ